MKLRAHRNRLIFLLCLAGVTGILIFGFRPDDAPIRYMETQYLGKKYFAAWCLPGKGVSRHIVLRPMRMPAKKWLSETPRGYVRAAINGPLFNSDSGVPFNEVGLGQGRWVADPKWSPCPVQRYCVGMDPMVSSLSRTDVTKMERKPYPPSVPRKYYHVPQSFQNQYLYGMSSIGVLVDSPNDAPRVHSPDESAWAGMWPESELARSALVWTDMGDFVLVEAESSTWQETGRFIVSELMKHRPAEKRCRIVGAVMLDGGSTAQFGWARRTRYGLLTTRIPVNQAREGIVVPLLVGVEVKYP